VTPKPLPFTRPIGFDMNTIDRIQHFRDEMRLRALQRKHKQLEDEKRVVEKRMDEERKRIERNREYGLKGQNIDKYV
jgi:predicted PP-loop superfamily ATPase